MRSIINAKSQVKDEHSRVKNERCHFSPAIFCFLLSIFFIFSTPAFSQSDTSKVKELVGLSLEDLMNIKVVTASGFAQRVSEAPSTMRVITAKQIEERGYEQIEDVLRDIEGVDIIHLSGYMPSVIYFRGLYGAENLRALLLIDGIRENNLVGTQELAGPAYSLHNVERIEIIWGPASALYGADAFGGVINIITKKADGSPHLYYEKGYGSYNTSIERAMVNLKKNNFNVSLSGSLYSTDGPRYLNRDQYYDGSFVDRAKSFYGTITHTSERFTTTFGYRTFETPMSWGTFLNSATKILKQPNQGDENTGAIGILYEDIRNEKPSLNDPYTNTAFLQTEFVANSKLTLLAHVNYRETGTSNKSYVYLSIDTTLSSTSTIDTVSIYRVPVFNYSNRMKGTVAVHYVPSENEKIYAGIELYQDNLEIGNRGINLDSNKYIVDGIQFTNIYPTFKPRRFAIRNNFGSYLQYVLNTNLFTKTSFTAGLRYDKNTDYESPLSPRLAVIIDPEKSLTLKLLYGTAFRSPTLTEIQAAITAFGSKAVHPEKVSTYEVNAIYHSSAKVLAQVNGFYNVLDDIFVLNSLTGGGFEQKQTQGRATVSGAEALLDLFPANNNSIFLNFTYQQGRQKDTKANTTFDIPNLPKVKGNIGVTHRVQELFTITAIANWIGDRELPHSNPYGASRNYTMAGYVIGNVVLTTQKFFENRVSASVNIQNVFNEAYLDPGIRSADGQLYSTVLEQPGRSMLFKITVGLF